MGAGVGGVGVGGVGVVGAGVVGVGVVGAGVAGAGVVGAGVAGTGVVVVVGGSVTPTVCTHTWSCSGPPEQASCAWKPGGHVHLAHLVWNGVSYVKFPGQGLAR